MINFEECVVNGDSVTFHKASEHCYWYGVPMDSDNQIKIFGLDVWESFVDIENGFFMIKGSLDGSDKNERLYINGKDYKDSVSNFINYLLKREYPGVSSDLLNDIPLIEPIPESFNLEKIVQFDTDLNDYYKKRYHNTTSW